MPGFLNAGTTGAGAYLGGRGESPDRGGAEKCWQCFPFNRNGPASRRAPHKHAQPGDPSEAA